MIKSIRLKNFKGFKEFQTALAPITLIGGRNNSGKSSILEAIMLFFAHDSSDCFLRMNYYHQMNDQNLMIPERLWEPLFYNFDSTRELSVDLSDGISRDRIFTLQRNEQISSATVETENALQNSFNQTGKLPIYYPLKFTYRMMDRKEEGNYSIVAPNRIEMEISKQTMNGTNHQAVVQMFKTETYYNSQLTAQWYGQIVLKDKKNAVINALKIFDDTIVDIQTIVQGVRAYLYIIFSNGQKRPLAYMGDGMGHLLNILMGIIANPNSLILIDEVENGFHYSIYEKFWAIVGSAAKDNNCQIIATSHSKGMIEGALVGLKSVNMAEKFTYIRLGKQGENVQAHIFDYELLNTAMTSEMEVR